MSKTWKSQERKLAKFLDEWWGAASGTFRRTPMSGAWDKKKYGGDIVTPDDCPLIFELKTGADWDFRQALSFERRTASGLFIKFTQQVVSDAVSCQKVPVLVLTKNRLPVYFLFPSLLWQTILRNSYKALKWIPFLDIWTGSWKWTALAFTGASFKETAVSKALDPQLIVEGVNEVGEKILENAAAYNRKGKGGSIRP